MSVAHRKFEVHETTVNSPLLPDNGMRALQRVGEVQREQNVSDRRISRRLKTTIEAVRRQQSPMYDMLLSELHSWQAALEVPIADLLVEPGPSLTPAVERRARLVTVMKTVRSLQLATNSPSFTVLVDRLAEQMVELMPELVHVDSWPIVGKRRSTDDISTIEERMLPDALLEGIWSLHNKCD